MFVSLHCPQKGAVYKAFYVQLRACFADGVLVLSPTHSVYMFTLLYIYFYIYLFTAIVLLPGGSGYFTCKKHENGFY